MCNCMNEKIEEMKTKSNLEYVFPPVEMISGRAALEFTIKEAGKKKARKIPLLLLRCPFCGKEYDEKQLHTLD